VTRLVPSRLVRGRRADHGQKNADKGARRDPVEVLDFPLGSKAAAVVGVNRIDSTSDRIWLPGESAVVLEAHVDAVEERHDADEKGTESEELPRHGYSLQKRELAAKLAAA